MLLRYMTGGQDTKVLGLWSYYLGAILSVSASVVHAVD